MKTPEICQDEQRRQKVRAHNLKERAHKLNGLDYVEVSEDQRTLTVYFLGKAPDSISRANVRIEGGRRVRDLRVEDLQVNRADDADVDDSMAITVDQPGDFSTYTLRLINDPKNPEDHVLDGFDPRYSELEFSFKAGCPTGLDCKTETICPPEKGTNRRSITWPKTMPASAN